MFAWDTELRGFGVRAKPSGVKTFLIQYRNVEGRTRRLVLGQYGVLTPENARHLRRRPRSRPDLPHVLRHTFASVAGDLGFSELTIAGLLGHSAHGVTQRYVHLDTALVVAADRVSMEIAKMLGCEAQTVRPGNTSCEHLALQAPDAAPQSFEEFEFSSLRIDFTHRQS